MFDHHDKRLLSKAQAFTIKLVKVLIFLGLWGIFILLSYKAIKKYMYEPIATEIVYTTGDDGVHIKFPIMTICPYDLASKSLEKCSNGTKFYQEALRNCLENDPSFDLKEYFKASHYEREDYFDDMLSIYGPQTRKQDQDKLWSPVIHARFGLCYSIDLDKSQIFSSQLKDYQRNIPVYTFELKNQRPWEFMVFLLSETKDLPDAYEIHPRKSIINGFRFWFRIKKKIVRGIHTEHSKCSRYSRKTCLEVYHQKRIEDKYRCDPTFLFNAGHLYNSNLTQCQNSETLQILQELLESQENVSDCLIPQACNQTKYTWSVEQFEANTTQVGIMYDDPVVEHHNAYYSYDIQSLLGEIGGTLGLTLGLSLSSINDYIDLLLQSIFKYHQS